MRTVRHLLSALLSVVLVLVVAGVAVAQEGQGLPAEQLARQNLRPYWHVFIAYAVAIVLVGAWAGSIAKRLAEVERRLGK